MTHQSDSQALLTDLYQLTMAQGYWKLGRADQKAVFHLFFRTAPFGGEFAIAAGIAPAVEFLQRFRFDESDLNFLSGIDGNDGKPLFEQEFLDYLGALRLSCDIDAVKEGTLVFGHEPILRVCGPILQCQLLETALLNIINFQTLIATKAARISAAADGEPVLEFGLRRAQGIDGGLSASRAAYLGGCAATSNVLAAKKFGIPVKGTHAHSWVMSFDSELESFQAYAEAMPNNCVFLVDTFNTLQGVRKATEVGRQLRARGHEMVGVRLDSGDLAHLSIQAREILDREGFPDAAIVASNDLNEVIIETLKHQGAQITVWGVGTQLATAYDQPALGGVYKLGATEDDNGQWIPKIKCSEQWIKTSIPGRLQVRRYVSNGSYTHDVIYDQDHGIDQRQTAIRLQSPSTPIQLDQEHSGCDLLEPIFTQGVATGNLIDLQSARQRCREQLAKLDDRIKRHLNPEPYRVALDINVHELRESLILSHQSSQAH